ncbi:hypothetical protein DAEQUDRAFT_553436 [Daedalea quercina L-15889]|uniref:Uncharacterized protein n=1 Tax=Daedalea quercina L-15889 TaxID=1314783 RepID=A0A165T4K4_9APHY|nr:hypothetical protein DAEQUDRAFT_553436 [Daedalea quercina L-15889]
MSMRREMVRSQVLSGRVSPQRRRCSRAASSPSGAPTPSLPCLPWLVVVRCTEGSESRSQCAWTRQHAVTCRGNANCQGERTEQRTGEVCSTRAATVIRRRRFRERVGAWRSE